MNDTLYMETHLMLMVIVYMLQRKCWKYFPL